jgi:uncharacterized membrane protein YsdA (DUF1294 family)/cold shock CspA family protein
MRYQGKIINWKDDQGFGFVIPNGSGQKAFVHIKAFPKSSSRPIDGDLITYDLASDEKRRFCAKNIRFAREGTSSFAPNKTSSLATIVSILFCVFLALLALKGRLPLALISVYLAASTITFLAYAIDKSAAQNNRWRIKESTLHLFGLAGGWPGALLAQKTLRHKTKKEEFQTVFWATVIANCFSLGWLLTTKSGSTFLSYILGQVA